MNSAHQPELVKLAGVITNYKVTRIEASFFFTDSDRNAMGVIAVAAAIVGLSGPAIATAANLTSIEEDADYVDPAGREGLQHARLAQSKRRRPGQVNQGAT